MDFRKKILIIVVVVGVVFGYKIFTAQAAYEYCQCKLLFKIDDVPAEVPSADDFCDGQINYNYNIGDYINSADPSYAQRIRLECNGQGHTPQTSGLLKVASESMDGIKDCQNKTSAGGLNYSYTLECKTITPDSAAFGAHHCIVLNDPDGRLKPGDCKDFTSVDIPRAWDDARSKCAVTATEAEKVELLNGKCPSLESAGGANAGATVDALKGQAAGLNKLGISSIPKLISRFINMLMAFIGSISLVLYIVAGFLWMTASGNTEKVTKAKSIMVWTTLGVVVMLASYMLASFIFTSLGL